MSGTAVPGAGGREVVIGERAVAGNFDAFAITAIGGGARSSGATGTSLTSARAISVCGGGSNLRGAAFSSADLLPSSVPGP